MDLADLLNNNDERRILNLVGRLDQTSLSVGDSVYAAAKYALARWGRRHSASYAANGVRINAVASGNVNTAMTATMSTNAKMALNALPIPTKYGKGLLVTVQTAGIFLPGQRPDKSWDVYPMCKQGQNHVYKQA